MRTVCSGVCRQVGWLVVAALVGRLGLIPLPAGAGQGPAMPLVLPQQSLPSLQQLNGTTSFTVICLSQAPVGSTGATAPTAVVDLSPPAGTVGPDGTFSLFMFPQDVPVVQQLNSGMPITPEASYPMPAGGAQIPVTQVKVATPGLSGSAGCLLVCPVPSLPLLGQLNPGLQFEVLCTSQVGSGQPAPMAQAALLQIQPVSGSTSPAQPLTLLLPVDTLPRLGQLNVGTTMDVINVTEVPVGGAIVPVALVQVQENATMPPPPSSSAGSGNSGDPGDENPGQGDGSNSGKGNGKGNGSDNGNGKGNGKGGGKGKGNGDD